MSDAMRQNPDGTWSEAIPEPLWVRPWWRLFRWKPSCCGITFPSREAYETHWHNAHTLEDAIRRHREDRMRSLTFTSNLGIDGRPIITPDAYDRRLWAHLTERP